MQFCYGHLFLFVKFKCICILFEKVYKISKLHFGTKQNDGSATLVITSKDGKGENVRTSPCENEGTGQAGSVLAVPPRKIHFSCSTTFLLAQFLEHKGSVVSESRALNRRIQFNNSFLSTYKRNR